MIFPGATVSPNCRQHKKRGFTLVEVMVAMTILSLSFVALLGLVNTSLQQAIYNRDNTRAIILARHYMEMLIMKVKRGDSISGVSMGDSEIDFGFEDMIEEDYPGFKVEFEVNPVDELPVEIPNGVELNHLSVTVKWGGDESVERDFTLESWVAGYQNR